MGRIPLSAAVWALVAASAAAIDYVTDMPLFSALAPCAQYAVSYNLQSQTRDACPDDGAPALQSCVCTKNKNLASISSRISASVASSCGPGATEDQASAQTVLSAYCNPSASVTFATPTAVSVYITEIPEVSYLAPCAESILTWAMMSMTRDLCPSEAPALASCACLKNRNSLTLSSLIGSSVKSACSGHTADVSSAQAMFAAYCAMNNGTTSFPVPSNPPGDMTYYISDLPEFTTLAACAKTGLTAAIQAQTYYFCATGPQALASCVCIKDGMTKEVLKDITSSVKFSCDSTAIEDVKFAVDVYNTYCSAALGSVTPSGITNSVEQTSPASRTPQQTRSSGNGNGNGSGNGGSGGSGAGGASTGNDTPTSSPSTAVIVGAVVGVVGGLALIGAAIFFVMRKVRKDRNEQLQIPDSAHGGDHPLGPYSGKAELPNDSVAAPPPPASPSQSMLKAAAPGRVDNVSPVSANTAAFTPPPKTQAELSGQPALYPPMPIRPELHGQGSSTAGSPPPPPSPHAPELYGQGAPSQNRPELHGQGGMFAPPPPPTNTSELQGQGTQFHNADPNRPELAGQYSYDYQQQQGYPPPVSPPQHHQQAYQAYGAGGAPPPPGAPYGQQSPQQQQLHPHSQAPWQSGPVPGYYEMDVDGHGTGRR